jgi:Leucine-rich repeat (LRR) protein
MSSNEEMKDVTRSLPTGEFSVGQAPASQKAGELSGRHVKRKKSKAESALASKRQHRELANAETETKIDIQDLSQDVLNQIFGFLPQKDQEQAAQVCKDWNKAMKIRRLYDLSPLVPLYTSEFRSLSSLFGILLPTHPNPNPSSRDVRVAGKLLLEIEPKILNILKGIHESEVLNDEEKKPFFEKTPQEIINDPSLLRLLLHMAYEHSLVAPFLNGKNQGPELSKSMTLAEKAKAVRNHLKEKGDTYIRLQCCRTGMLCFPIEFCSLKNLQNLDVSYNRITALPQEIGQLAKLQVLFTSHNQINALPPEIGKLAALRQLEAFHNQICSLPSEIERLTALENLFVSENQITALPPEITGFRQFIHIDLSKNPLTIPKIPKFPANIQVHL